MAESSFAKLDHRVALPQAEVRHIGGGWNTPAGTTIRDDRTTHLPLVMPVGDIPAARQEEAPPPPPTEQELRGALQQAIASKQFADDQLDRARATRDRAVRHVERCRERLVSFDGLDDEITAATVAALSSDAGRLDLDEALRQKRAGREVAKADAQAAANALAVLAAALTEAQADAEHAATAARRAAVAVAALTAVQLAERVVALEDEAARTREILVGYDRIAAGTKVPMAPVLFDVVTADAARLLRPVDSTVWRAALDALMADASAEIEISIPPPAPARPLLRFVDHEVRNATPIRPLHVEPEPEVEPPAATETDPS